MRYQVVLSRSAEREFRNLPDAVAHRVGAYRILYTIDEKARLITVHAVGHRRDVYRR